MKKVYKILSTKAKAAFQKGTVATLCIMVASLFIMGAGKFGNVKQRFRRRIRYLTGFLPAIAILLIVGGLSACERSNDNPSTGLKGTKWKLAGIVDVQADTMTELEPKDCKECYTLTFDTDNTVSVHMINGIVYHLDLSNLTPNEYIRAIAYTYLWNGEEYSDPDNFRLAILLTEDYTATSSEIKLFYHQKNNYLLFKLIN